MKHVVNVIVAHVATGTYEQSLTIVYSASFIQARLCTLKFPLSLS